MEIFKKYDIYLEIIISYLQIIDTNWEII